MYPSKPCLNITSSRKPSLFPSQNSAFHALHSHRRSMLTSGHILPLAPLVFVYTWFPCVTACFPRPGVGPHCSPNRPEAGFHLERDEIKQYFLFKKKKKDNLKWQGEHAEKILFGNYWYYLLQTFSPSYTYIFHWAPQFHGQTESDGVFCRCLYVDVQTPLLCSPPSIIECLKKKNQPQQMCVSCLILRLNRNESI